VSCVVSTSLPSFARLVGVLPLVARARSTSSSSSFSSEKNNNTTTSHQIACPSFRRRPFVVPVLSSSSSSSRIRLCTSFLFLLLSRTFRHNATTLHVAPLSDLRRPSLLCCRTTAPLRHRPASPLPPTSTTVDDALCRQTRPLAFVPQSVVVLSMLFFFGGFLASSASLRRPPPALHSHFVLALSPPHTRRLKTSTTRDRGPP